MNGTRTGGFTLIEILVVVGIVGILSAILTTLGIRGLHASKVSNCLSNLRQIGIASEMYANDHDGSWPPYAVVSIGGDSLAGAKELKAVLRPYGATSDIFYCPLDPFARQSYPHIGDPGFPASSETSYSENFNFLALGTIVAKTPVLEFLVSPSQAANPSGCATFHDWIYHVNPLDRTSPWASGHGSLRSTLFVDGHVKEVPLPALNDSDPVGKCEGVRPIRKEP